MMNAQLEPEEGNELRNVDVNFLAENNSDSIWKSYLFFFASYQIILEIVK